MDAPLVLQQRLHRRRQRVPRGDLIGEQRVAAHRWNDVAVQQRGLRRPRQEAPVRMPGLGEDLRLLVGVAPHLRNVRMAGYAAEEGVDAEGADVQRDALQVLQRQVLVREGQHLVLQPGAADRGHRVGRQRLAQVDALHDGPAGGGLRGDRQGHGVASGSVEAIVTPRQPQRPGMRMRYSVRRPSSGRSSSASKSCQGQRFACRRHRHNVRATIHGARAIVASTCGRSSRR